MYERSYQPEGAWFGDCMPFFHDGVYYLFHQRDTRKLGPFGEPFGWALATTTDFVTYTDHGEVIPRGGDDEQDRWQWRGTVVVYEGYRSAQGAAPEFSRRSVVRAGVLRGPVPPASNPVGRSRHGKRPLDARFGPVRAEFAVEWSISVFAARGRGCHG